MIVLNDLEALSTKRFPKPILTLGAFDGVHLGHQRILRFLKKRARATGGTACVLTFKEHPQKILNPNENLSILTSTSHKLALLSRFGVDLCLAIDFTKDFSKLSPKQFIKDVLVNLLHVKEVYLGPDARFGHERRGRVDVMEQMAVQYAFRFGTVPAYRVNGQTVSSTLIRNLVRQGRLAGASRLLGRPYSIVGKVVAGTGRGRHLGFPTANVDPESEVLPPQGVYMVSANLLSQENNRWQAAGEHVFQDFRIERCLQGVLNLGSRPTFNSKPSPVVAEAHLLDWSGALYGRTVDIIFHRWLRPEIQFESEGDLREQIFRDREATRNFFRGGSLYKREEGEYTIN